MWGRGAEGGGALMCVRMLAEVGRASTSERASKRERAGREGGNHPGPTSPPTEHGCHHPN